MRLSAVLHRAALRAAMVGVACISTGAFAQSYNIDFGETMGTPHDAYGAAAGQTGHWMSAWTLENPLALVDITGAATPAVLTANLPFGQAFQDDPGTELGDEALLDDYLDLHSTPVIIEIANLQPGNYRAWVYSWAPDSPFFGTFMAIQNHDEGLVGGAWSGAFEEGITHGYHEFHIAQGGVLKINMFGFPKGTLNGMQLSRLPTPGSLAIGAAASVIVLRRKR